MSSSEFNGGVVRKITDMKKVNVAGEWITTLVKDGIVGNNEVYDEEGSLSWDLRNYEGLKVASGLYLYQLEGQLLGKTVYKEGKIAIVLGP